MIDRGLQELAAQEITRGSDPRWFRGAGEDASHHDLRPDNQLRLGGEDCARQPRELHTRTRAGFTVALASVTSLVMAP